MQAIIPRAEILARGSGCNSSFSKNLIEVQASAQIFWSLAKCPQFLSGGDVKSFQRQGQQNQHQGQGQGQTQVHCQGQTQSCSASASTSPSSQQKSSSTNFSRFNSAHIISQHASNSNGMGQKFDLPSSLARHIRWEFVNARDLAG